MPSIYDSYQLANSQRTEGYVGNTLGELRDLGNEMQRRYDTTVGTIDNIEMIKRQVATDPKSKALLDQTLAGINQQLEGLASREDKENLVRPAHILARDFAQDAKSFIDNANRVTSFNAEVDKNDKLDATTKQRLKSIEYNMYGGLKRDAATGRITNQFSPRLTPAEGIDANEVVNKITQGIQASSQGKKVTYINGNYYYVNGTEYKAVPAERVQNIANNIIGTDPKIQAYMKFQGDLDGLEKGMSIRRMEDIPDALRPDIETLMAKGLSLQESTAELFRQRRINQIQNGLVGAAVGKAAFSEVSTESGVLRRTEEANDAADEAKNTATRLAIATPAWKVANDLAGQGLGSLNSGASDKVTQISDAESQVAALIRNNAAPDEISAAQGQLAALQGQKDQMQGIQARSLDQAARALNFPGGYADYQRNSQRKYVANVVDKGVSDKSGVLKGINANGKMVNLPKADLAKAIMDGTVKPITEPTARGGISTAPTSGSPSAPGGISGYEVEVNGKRVVIDGRTSKAFSDIHGIMREAGKDPVGKEIYKKADNLLKEGKILATGGTGWSMKKQTSESLGQLYKTSPGSFNVYDLETGERVDDTEELPQDMQFGSIEAIRDPSGEPVLYGSETTGKKGEEKTRRFRIVPLPGTNIPRVVAGEMFEEARKTKDPTNARDLYNTGTSLMKGDWETILQHNMTINERIPLRDAFNEEIGSIQKAKNSVNGDIVYRIFDEQGKQINIVDPANGTRVSAETDAGRTGRFIQQLIQSASMQRAQELQKP